jgi:hypothetical protein
VRRLVLDLEEAEFKRIEKAAYTRPLPDYIRAVVNAVLDYREQQPAEKSASSRYETRI